MRIGNVIVVRSSTRPPDHVTVDPVTFAFQPGGATEDTTAKPGGAFTRTATVACGGRSFGVANPTSVSTPSSTNGGEMVTWAACRDRYGEGNCDDGERPPHGKPRWRAMTMRWTSFVPSPISRIF